MVFVLMLIIISLACNMTPQQIQKGAGLLTDDFTGADGGWSVWSKTGESAVSVIDGKLTMILQQPNTDIITTNDISHPDLQISVNAQLEHGSRDNLIGLVCRFQNDKNYYGFVISSDGYFGVIRKYQGETKLLNSSQMEFSETINQGNIENDLEAICAGESLVFSINAVEVASVNDGNLEFGGNGLLIGSFDTPNDLVVSFDDFKLTAR